MKHTRQYLNRFANLFRGNPKKEEETLTITLPKKFAASMVIADASAGLIAARSRHRRKPMAVSNGIASSADV